ncbi:hypothetical protein D7Z54_01450 [Salibacterium salarium]|uniref:Uncharacterized protein n=1 Tax=Salibacterium salarium TaxID=284579 RepID=A0A3R9QX32_9BACI|nr:hypothetical protein [Salibacterium salarium]RSL35260.1 hypothetical protein D7Z54_01450 [Salibacterium salarium]
MSDQIKQKLQDILHSSINKHKFERAEDAVTHLRQLAEIEAFISEEEPRYNEQSVRSQNNGEQSTGLRDTVVPNPSSIKSRKENDSTSSANKDTLELYYMEEDSLLKFKKSPQTYTVSIEFFRTFLENLHTWKGKEPFSSKTYYDQFFNQLHEMSNYQNSTLRQFITLLFRFAYRLGVLEKTSTSQRSRYVTADAFEVEHVLNNIFEQKIVYL